MWLMVRDLMQVNTCRRGGVTNNNNDMHARTNMNEHCSIHIQTLKLVNVDAGTNVHYKMGTLLLLLRLSITTTTTTFGSSPASALANSIASGLSHHEAPKSTTRHQAFGSHHKAKAARPAQIVSTHLVFRLNPSKTCAHTSVRRAGVTAGR